MDSYTEQAKLVAVDQSCGPCEVGGCTQTATVGWLLPNGKVGRIYCADHSPQTQERDREINRRLGPIS